MTITKNLILIASLTTFLNGGYARSGESSVRSRIQDAIGTKEVRVLKVDHIYVLDGDVCSAEEKNQAEIKAKQILVKFEPLSEELKGKTRILNVLRIATCLNS